MFNFETHFLSRVLLLPEYDDDAVEYVEAVLDVPEDAEGPDLEDHLQGEDSREDDVADLHDLGELLRL